MMGLLISEMLFYGGVIGMAIAAITTVACAVIFSVTGKRLKRKLEQEYGKPFR